MVGSRNGDRVDLLADLVEELAVVMEPPRLRPRRGALAKAVLVDVAQRNDLHERPGLFDVAGALAPDADPGDAQAPVGPVRPHYGGGGAGEQVPKRRGRTQSQNLPAGQEEVHGIARGLEGVSAGPL